MPKTKKEKKEILEDLKQKIEEKRGIYFVDFKGFPSSSLFRLRGELKERDGLFYVVKKTLAKKALEGVDLDDSFWEGQVAFAFVFGDEVGPAKALDGYGLKIKGGILDGEVLSKERVLELAKLPSQEELKTRLVRSLQSPLSGLRNSLEGSTKGLLVVLKTQI